MRELTVELGARSYPIYIGQGLLGRAGELFENRGISTRSPLLIVTDENVVDAFLAPLSTSLEARGFAVSSIVVPAGEKSKSLEMLQVIITAALDAGLDRRSAIVALGGGVVGDLAGYAAASYMRGIRFIQVPTTILAHDSSVGGKVAVNHPQAKNIIGAFHQPELVLYDLDTLSTLPSREISSGLAEVVKHGLISDAEFVQWCVDNGDSLLRLDPGALGYALFKGCSVKAEIVSGDERENGRRAVLNLGHTIGHALEAVAGYDELRHGEAIAIGMIGSAMLGVELGAPQAVYEETRRALGRVGLPVRLPEHFEVGAIMEAMMHDKKFAEGKMTFIVPVGIGEVEIRSDIDADRVRSIVERLKQEESWA